MREIWLILYYLVRCCYVVYLLRPRFERSLTLSGLGMYSEVLFVR